MRNWQPALCLTLLLAFGSYIRLANLGHGDFGVDELYQVFAAHSIARGEGPILPSGEPYLRGLDVTHLVRHSFDAFGTSEFVARLPSAAFGVLALFLFAAVLWSIGGAWIAVAGTALLAIYPEGVAQSRALRFYTYQLTLGVLAFYTGWRAVRDAGRAETPGRDTVVRQWGWAGATLIILLLAARVQVVSLSVLAGWLSIVALAAAADLVRRGRTAWRRSMPVQMIVTAIGVGLLLLVFASDLVGSLLRRARSVPAWVIEEGGMKTLSYYYGLVETFPLLVALLPLILLAAVARRPRLGTYAVIWFGVPLFLHTFYLAWKGARFVMVPMLGLFVASAIAIAWAGEALFTRLRARTSTVSRGRMSAQAVAGGVVAIAALSAFVTQPAFNRSRKMVNAGTERWTATAQIIRSMPELEGIPYAHRRPLHPAYYWGRIDFIVGERRLAEATERRDGEWEIQYNPVGSLDRTSGVPVLPTPESIREAYGAVGAVLIGAEEQNGRLPGLTAALTTTLKDEAEELCRGRCGNTRLYLWRFGAPVEVPLPDTTARMGAQSPTPAAARPANH